MKKFESVLLYLDGRKLILISFATVVIGILNILGAINADLMGKLLAVLNLIGGGAAVYTNSAAKENTPLGNALRTKRTN